MKKLANYLLTMFSSLKFIFCLSLLFFLLVDRTESVRIEVENLPERCGYAKCAAVSDRQLNVHLVPHTHADVGWLKTVDQYYYGSRSNIQKASVQLILDSVVQALVRNKDRKFIFVETAFFAKWWQEQDEQTKDVVKELVKTGQLEFIGGGWTMNCEATTHYSSIIDQMTLGHQWLNETFGHCATPKVAWQIDPFGHSKEIARIFAQMNFDGLFFARIDFEDHTFRRTEKTMEHVWHSGDDLSAESDLFTSVFNNGYGPPEGFNWDLLGGNDDPVIDNSQSEEYNVDAIVEKFVTVSKQYSLNYATNHIIFLMGEDFNFQSANLWFKNIDKLIKHVNRRQNQVRVFYSTPSCYLKALHDTGHVFSTKEDDLFPYSSDPNAFWTGYFTSRPSLKRFERVGNNWHQACKQLDVLATHEGAFESKIRKLKEAMGVMQHHDAVAGTEKQHVANDYAKQLQLGIDQCKDVINHGLKQLITYRRSSIANNLLSTDFQFCDLLNTSTCYATEKYRNLVVTLYNPYSHSIQDHTVRLPVKVEENQFIEVLDSRLKPISSSIFPIARWVQTIPGRSSRVSYELVFDVAEIPPLGFVSLFIKRTDTASENSAVKAIGQIISENEQTIFQQKERKIFLKHGLLEKISLPGRTVELENNFYYYEGHTGNNKIFTNQSSGAYIFRPKEQTAKPLGRLLHAVAFIDPRPESSRLIEIQQTYDSFVQQNIRIHPKKDFIEFDWFVSSIPVEDNIGKEVVVRYSTNLVTRKTFYTDANGRQILKRIRNFRPSWNYTVFEPVAGNYYPVNSRLFLRDYNANLQMTLLTDRTQGGSSLRDGEVELMLHRRLLHDDAFGVDEALNETGPDGRGLQVRGRHFLLINQIDSSAAEHRPLGQQLYLEPVIAFMPENNLHLYQLFYQTKFSGINHLPANVHILTLEQWRPKSVLLRLEHFYQENEDTVLSKPATVQLNGLFPFINIVKLQEMTLSANQDIGAQKKRLQFKFKGGKSTNYHLQPIVNGTVQLNPMQIRTFIVTYL